MKSAATASNMSPVKSKKRLNILVVDDDPLYRKIISQVAQKFRVKVHLFNPVDDPQSLDGKQFDAAIVDFDLGATDGARFMASIESLIGVIPTVLVSGTRKEELPERKWPDSIRGFIPKTAGHVETVMSALDMCIKFHEEKEAQ